MTDRKTSEGLTLEQAIGQVLRSERRRQGLKQVEVSVATDFDIRSIRIMEHGEKSMTIRSLDVFAQFYELPLEEIIIRAKQLRSASL